MLDFLCLARPVGLDPAAIWRRRNRDHHRPDTGARRACENARKRAFA